MSTQKYAVNQYPIDIILSWVKSGEIAIPEIQRPFVWDSTKVRDLMDSLYHGYPIGYLIAWRNPNVKLKDGSTAEGKKILIDGQQRVTALTAAILAQQVITKDYKQVKIRIAFQPVEQRFEVYNTAIAKDNAWVHDIAPLVSGQERVSRVVRKYLSKNSEADEEKIEDAIEALRQIVHKQIGLIELAPDLDIETVTEIFIRINSQGVVLSQADFAMSKIAADEKYGGGTLRKAIDYFCHLAVAPEFYSTLVDVDKEFTNTPYFQKMAWLKSENDDLYDPAYTDMLRVAFAAEFNRGRLADLVSLLSGRNFETRTFEEEIRAASFATLDQGILNFINENNFKRFVMIIKSAGFTTSRLIRSQNALNFAYTLYLKLRGLGYKPGQIEKYVTRWFVMSVLTGRYSGSADSQFDFDIKLITNGQDFAEVLADIEAAELSDSFWKAALVQNLTTSVASNPNFLVYLASQVKTNDKGFLSKDITVGSLIEHRGDIHHIFPRNYLKKQGLTRRFYNQIANYVYMQSEINIQIGNKAPNIYFGELAKQCKGGPTKYGRIKDKSILHDNLAQHAIPEDVFEMTIDHYEEFLRQRRRLMAHKIRDYYFSL